MRTFGPAVKVGITVLAVIIGGYWSFMMLAKGSCAGEQQHMVIHSYFKDATLLVEKSRVQIAGLNVGHILSRELNVRPPRQKLIEEKRFAKITIALVRPVKLYSNAIIYKRSASLLGDFYIELDPGTYEWVDETGKKHVGETLKSGSEIKYVVEASTVTGVVSQVSDMMPVIKGLVEDVRRFTKGPLNKIGTNINDGIVENRRAIKAIVDNMEKITKDIRGITTNASQDVNHILADIRTITSEVRQLVDDPKTKGELKRGVSQLSSAVDKLDRAMNNAEGISDDVKGITGDIQEGKGTVGRLLKDDALINEVEGTVREVGDVIRGLTQIQTVVGLRSEYNFHAGSIKTYVSVELRPRPDKYYLIELIDDPRGRREITTDITRTDDPTKPFLVRTDNLRISDQFRLSFQFAKKLNFVTFRFGIKESTGGVGLDVSLLNDDLQIWTDVFDSQSNIYPRLKFLAAWRFFSSLYIIGGADDVLNERPLDGVGGGRDFFLGAYLRFNDRDLRSLLMMGGGSISTN